MTLAQIKAAKATITTDLSSTDDAQYTQQQSGFITKKSYTCPPKYNGNIYLNYSTHHFNIFKNKLNKFFFFRIFRIKKSKIN